MARMVPFPALPTKSRAERRLYEGFLEQLDDAYVVYHSVDWLLVGPRGGPDEGEADFVIAHPEDGLLVLEAKGGRLEHDPATGRWTQTGRSGSHALRESPFDQAKNAMYTLVEILEARPGWERWKPSFGYGVAFPDGVYETAAGPGSPVEIALDARHMETLTERVRSVMRFHRRGRRTFGAVGMDQLAEALGQRVEIRLPLGVTFAEEDRKIVELTDEQSWVRGWIVKQRRAAVVGGAGSGKTVLAIDIARRMGQGGNRTLLTCFNKRIADHLRRSTEGTPHLDALHFHALAHRIVSEAGIDLPDEIDSGPGSDFFEERLPDLLMEAASRVETRYDVIVVDEGQDFRDHWWPALLSLAADPGDVRLYVFSDDGQNLYGGALPEQIPEEARFSLPKNLRNTREIGDFVSVFYRGTQPPRTAGPDGRPVEILGYADDDDLAGLVGVVLRNLIEGEQVPAEDIVVLTPSGAAKSRLRGRGEAGGYRLSEDPAPGEVLATSVHSFKGLERPVVILAELGDKHLVDLEQYLYIGGSRASSHLLVLATETVASGLRDEMSR